MQGSLAEKKSVLFYSKIRKIARRTNGGLFFFEEYLTENFKISAAAQGIAESNFLARDKVIICK